jgi:hypothetical protein
MLYSAFTVKQVEINGAGCIDRCHRVRPAAHRSYSQHPEMDARELEKALLLILAFY